MLDGLDEVDWASMSHAYGPAVEAPDILRGLVSDDPDTREFALDDFYGSLHHQGDIYECTIASVPFLLEIVTSPAPADRGAVLELLASIGGVEGNELTSPGSDVVHNAAVAALAEALPRLVPLLDDPDPEVRREVPYLLAACRGESAAAAMAARLPVETDRQARAKLVRAVGLVARELPPGPERAAWSEWLSDRARSDADPVVRLSASVGPVGAVDDRAVVVALGELYAEAAAAGPRPPVPATAGTLIGTVRAMLAENSDGVAADWASELAHGVAARLGAAGSPGTFVTGLLALPQWHARRDACSCAQDAIRRRRGDHADMIEAVGRRLTDPEPRVVAAAVQTLTHAGPLAAPCADALYEIMADDDGPVLHALAGLGDARALPAVLRVLERDTPPSDVGLLLSGMRAYAVEMLPLVARRMIDTHRAEPDHRVAVLATAVGRCGPSAAAHASDLVEIATSETTEAWIRGKAMSALAALARGSAVSGASGGAPGGAADGAVVGRGGAAGGPFAAAGGAAGGPFAAAGGAVADLLAHPDPRIRLGAATAHYAIAGDPDPALRAVSEGIGDDGLRADALALAGELGPDGAALAPLLAAQLADEVADPDEFGWAAAWLASALWRVTRDPSDAVVSALAGAARRNRLCVGFVAERLAEIGPPAAPAAPVLAAELADPVRHNHNVTAGTTVADDIQVLATCAAALDVIGVPAE